MMPLPEPRAPHAEPCGGLQVVSAEVSNLKLADERQWKAIEALQQRLPTWATLLIGVLMAYSGWITGRAFG